VAALAVALRKILREVLELQGKVMLVRQGAMDLVPPPLVEVAVEQEVLE
jgi:hypothetical protein